MVPNNIFKTDLGNYGDFVRRIVLLFCEMVIISPSYMLYCLITYICILWHRLKFAVGLLLLLIT